MTSEEMAEQCRGMTSTELAEMVDASLAELERRQSAIELAALLGQPVASGPLRDEFTSQTGFTPEVWLRMRAAGLIKDSEETQRRMVRAMALQTRESIVRTSPSSASRKRGGYPATCTCGSRPCKLHDSWPE